MSATIGATVENRPIGRAADTHSMRILLVEDELKTSEYLRKGLSEHGFMVDVARNGASVAHCPTTSW